MAINLGKLQHDEAEARAASSLAASREAGARTMEETEAANRRRKAAEERERDLLSSNAALQREVKGRRALLASSPGEVALAEAELLRRHDDLMLEVVEHSLALERLEVRERQAAVAEDAVAAREAQVLVEVEKRVAKARAEMDGRHRLDLELLKAELEGRTSILKTKLQAMEQCEGAARGALASSESALNSTRAKISSLRMQAEDTAFLLKKASSEKCRRLTLEREHGSMLQGLRIRANNTLGAICDESTAHPHENDYACHLPFFTDIITRLEDQVAQARQLVKERSRGLLGHALSHIFSNLLNLDSHFDFGTVLAPVPAATQDKLAKWVDGHVDALVTELTPEDDTAVLAAKGADTGGDDEEDSSYSTSSADGSDEEGASI